MVTGIMGRLKFWRSSTIGFPSPVASTAIRVMLRRSCACFMKAVNVPYSSPSVSRMNVNRHALGFVVGLRMLLGFVFLLGQILLCVG